MLEFDQVHFSVKFKTFIDLMTESFFCTLFLKILVFLNDYLYLSHDIMKKNCDIFLNLNLKFWTAARRNRGAEE